MPRSTKYTNHTIHYTNTFHLHTHFTCPVKTKQVTTLKCLLQSEGSFNGERYSKLEIAQIDLRYVIDKNHDV